MELTIDGIQLLLSEGDARYIFEIYFDGKTLSFVLHEKNPVERPEGVIDAPPAGNVERGDDGFVAVYPEGWEPPRRLAVVVESALRKMYIMSRKGVFAGPDGEPN